LRNGDAEDQIATKGVTIAVVEHAIAVLRCLSASPEALGINEIARRTDLHKSSVSRLIATLAPARLVERDPITSRIRLGAGLVVLAAPVLANLHIRDLVRPTLEQLALSSGETASYNLWDGFDAVTIEQAQGPGAIRIFSEPGRRDPGHSTACGKILLAHQPTSAIEAYCAAGLKRFNERTIVDPVALRQELATARERGYAVNFGELEADISAISAISRDAHGHPLGSVTLTVPSFRFLADRREELIALVVDAAQNVSLNMGFRG
jgi:DNA-binding IclR family transcriptional regulator